jgi:hypothetical protein
MKCHFLATYADNYRIQKLGASIRNRIHPNIGAAPTLAP